MNWETPPTLSGVRGPKGCTPDSIELSQVSPLPVGRDVLPGLQVVVYLL